MSDIADNAPAGAPDPDRAMRDAARRRRALFFGSVALLALLAVIGGGYALLSARVPEADWQRQLQELDRRQAALATQLADLDRSIQQFESDLEQLGSAQQAQAEALAQLKVLQSRDNLDWTLDEIEYLLIIALHRLKLERDRDTALAALEAAALRLGGIDEPGLIPARAQLAADIERLKAVERADVTGLVLYLGDLVSRVQDLPLKDSGQFAPAPPEPEEEAITGWRAFFRAVWREFKSLVSIRRVQEPPPVLLAPPERYFLYQNLRLELEAARLAVLRRDTANLHFAANHAGQWLKQYFDARDMAVANAIEALERMREVDLDPPLPDIDSSLETLRAYIRERAAEDGGG
jgi:uroporphyrin-3 C-methyltransferase